MENPVALTRSVKDTLTYVSSGGAPVFVWPGGGITYMVDVTQMPKRSFGYVPTPAIVAPVEFTLRLDDYLALGGHEDSIIPVQEALVGEDTRNIHRPADMPWPLAGRNFPWGRGRTAP